ncbi:MAG: Ig-like domain-containing protein [Clostridia bacterium]|nr:Ig-like domain-containing protein [Clostridia bacterium]
MKKVLCFILTAALVISMVSLPSVFSVDTAGVDDTEPCYALSGGEYCTGDTFDVFLSIRNNPGIISARCRIYYDANAFSVESIEDLGLLNGFTTPPQNLKSPFILRWADPLAAENNTGNGDIARITFKVLDGASVGSHEISVEPVESFNFNGEKLQFLGAATNITVKNRLYGDADGDGEITDWDAILFDRYLANWTVENIDEGALDIDRDGEISDWDAILLKRYLAGWNIEINPQKEIDPREFRNELPKVTPAANTHFHIDAENTGFNVFAPVKGNWGYRYGPSIIYYPDGTMDAWFATPGTSGEWDWFTYKHSDDGGKTWSKEKLVLQPTPDSYDHYSVCDPGVIYFGGYYYLGYTSTIVSTNGGINNNVFVARSENPDGPFEKWNGSGWGGDPMPIVYYNESDDKWGAGEPSFVLLDGTLYIYYTWACDTGDFKYVATADATDPNWPATMEFKGRAFTSTGGDQLDVVYVEDAGLFMGVQTMNRFTANSGIQIWESKDGIHFIKGEFIRKNIAQYCHNMGISKRTNGHIQLSDTLLVGYAYCDGADDNWGKWATRFNFITITTYQSKYVNSTPSSDKNVLITDGFWPKESDPQPEGITTIEHLVKLNVGDTNRSLKVYWIDANISRHQIYNSKDITFSDYDTSVIQITGTSIKGLKAGKTTVKATYKGFSVVFKVYVYPKGFNYNNSDAGITSAVAVEPELTIYKGRTNGAVHKFQMRILVRFDDDTWGECYNDSTAAHSSYPAMVPSEKYPVTYTSSDPSIATVSADGMITAKGVGDVTIIATIGPDNNLVSMLVHVVAAPSELNWSDSAYKW